MFANNKGYIGLFQQTTGLSFGHFFYTLQVDHRQIRYKDPKWWEMDFLCQRSTARGTELKWDRKYKQHRGQKENLMTKMANLSSIFPLP